MTPEEAEAEYRRVMGLQALERQKQAAKERYSCCAQLKENGHLPLCRSHPLRKT